jgi:hypothetical protein
MIERGRPDEIFHPLPAPELLDQETQTVLGFT